MQGNGETQEASGLRERLKWFLALRLIIAAVLVAATILWQPEVLGNTRQLSFIDFLFITGAHLIVCTVAGLLYEQFVVQRLFRFAFSQIFWDLLFVTILVYVTGGIDSEISGLYALTIFNASLLLFRTGAYTSAFLAGLFYAALLNVEFLAWIPIFYGFSGSIISWTEQAVITSIGKHVALFFVVAYVASYVSTKLYEAEKKLREKSVDLEDLELLTTRIVDSLTSGLVTLDHLGRITFWSQVAEKITGISEMEVKGKTFVSLFPNADKYLTETDEENFSKAPYRWEMEFQRNEDEKKILGFSISPLRHSEEGKRGRLVIFQDLTKFREMEEHIRRADRLAALGELAARMAHEIRNPLTSVAGSIEVLQSHLNLQDQDKRLMEIVVKETDRLNSLLTDFLLFAKPAKLELEEISLRNLLEESIELFTKSSKDRKVLIDLQTKGEGLLRGDPKQLSQVFWNLLKNASESMNGKGKITVSLQDHRNIGHVSIRIEDEGKGLPPNSGDKLFHPFFTTKKGGTGLGLATVQRIVQDHGGIIRAENKADAGAAFVVELPVSLDLQNAMEIS